MQIEIVREAIGMAVIAHLHGSCIRGTPGVPLTFNWTLNADKIKVFMPRNHRYAGLRAIRYPQGDID